MHQVGCNLVQQQAAFGEGLGHELEVEVVEVAQTAVHELGGPGAGTCGPVAGFDDAGAQATSYSVERDTGAGDTAADHEDVEFFGAHALESLSAGCSGQLRLLCKVLGSSYVCSLLFYGGRYGAALPVVLT